MNNAHLHDAFVLLDGSKRWALPGTCRVQVGLAASVDAMQVPGDENQVTQTQEAAGDVQVDVAMTKNTEWEAYQHVLARLRRGTQDGPAVFTCAHPEVRARRIKRLYFVSEQGQPYSAASGYRVTLKFSEKQKAKAPVANADTGLDGLAGFNTLDGGGTTNGPTGTAPSTAKGQASLQSALASLISTPQAVDGGRATTATPGHCSAWDRVAATAAGISPALYGASALATEANWRRAGLSVPWNADSAAKLENGDKVFWGDDPSGYGHMGTVVGRDKDGMPLIAGNNLVTYKQKGGRFDSRGMPIDRNIDSRGVVRLDQLSSRNSQPTSVGKPGGVPKAGPRIQGPAAPVGLPSQRPSAAIPQPPAR